MPNEMRRPCTLPAHWKQTEPFDAMKIGTFLYRPVPYHTQTKKKTEYRIELFINDSDSIFSPPARDKKELEQYKFEAITTIAEALNAPVLATDAVLAGLPKDAKVYEGVNHESNGIKTQMKCFLYWGLTDKKEGWMYREHDLDSLDGESYDYLVSKSDKLYADDPKTAEYLRQFTLEGVRIKEGG